MVNFIRLEQVRTRRPLIHCVSNIVSANDCANLALAAGASPIMAHAPEEMAEITAASQATVLNTGTPDGGKFAACRLCGREARRRGQPVILDPVGIGASPWRLERVRTLLEDFTPTILRVNPGEAQALLRGDSEEQGVDSPSPSVWRERAATAVALARQRGAVVLLSGPEDAVTDGQVLWRVSGGSPMMAKVTGTGCMLSVLCGVFAAVEPAPLSAALLASAFWKACAWRAEAEARGPGSFRTALLDAAGMMTAETLAAAADLKRCAL